MPPAGQSNLLVGGRFALETEHKRGGMGTVWRGRNLSTERPVAVKILHEDAVEQTERFAREAALLAALAHGSIVSYVADGVTADGQPFLAMEWLEGENVAERLERGRLTLAESLALVRAAARALAVAHERGIVHRDLKPSNLFLRRGSVEDVVVLDLGIARHVGGADAFTRAGTILGTPSYMAPEQAQGLVHITPAADVFSLGCVLFECLTGAPPFVGNHVFAVLAKVLFEAAPRLPDAPAKVEALVDRMLDKNPARRPADAAAVLAALDALSERSAAPRAGVRRHAPVELELVSVILATGGSRGQAAPTADATALDLTVFGGERRFLADGTAVITLPHRRGAATDLAVRAARLALRLRETDPGTSIVLATGRGAVQERSHIGEVVDRAASMLRSRGPLADGSIRIDDVTAGLLDSRFHVAAVAEGVLALEGEESTIDPTRPLLGRPTACVGREHELATLQLTLRVCVDESCPRAVMVVGAPGLGKTRLRHELIRRTQNEGEVRVLVGLGNPVRTASTCGLLGGAVARFCGVRGEASAAENRAALQARVSGSVAEPERLRTAVFLGELCGVRFPREALPELNTALHDPRLMGRLIEQAWLTFLRAEAAAAPVLLVLDDLHWSDALSVALVNAALRELDSSPVMVLALARPEVTEAFPDLWAPRLAVVPLRPLGEAATARLVRQALGDRIGDDSVKRIVTRSAGNALYLEELIRAAEAGREAVPETVVAMLQARIGLLAPTVRRVLRAASVFGESFPVAGVEAVVGGTLAPGEIEAALATLARHEILEQRTGEPDGRSWRFRHALMRDAAYGLLTAEDRAAYHRLAARHLTAAGEDDAVVGGHYELGGEPDAALQHFIVAAEQAQRRGDHAPIMDLVARARAVGATGPTLGIIRGLEAPMFFFRYDFAACWAAVKDALALLPLDHRWRANILAQATFFGVQMGRFAEVMPFFDELIAVEPEAKDRGAYALALGLVGLANVLRANRAEATQILERYRELDALGNRPDLSVRGHYLFFQAAFGQWLGEDPYGTWTFAKATSDTMQVTGNRRFGAVSAMMVGEGARRVSSVEESVRRLRDGVAAARGLSEIITLDFVTQFLTRLLADHGTPEELEEARRLAVAPVERPPGMYRALGLVALALIALRDGDAATAEAHARAARADVDAHGLRAVRPHADLALVRALVAKGDPLAGLVADEALAHVEAFGPMGYLDLPVRLAAARAYMAAGRRDDAVRAAGDALGALRRQAARIPDAASREGFLQRVPENAAILRMAEELGVA